MNMLYIALFVPFFVSASCTEEMFPLRRVSRMQQLTGTPRREVHCASSYSDNGAAVSPRVMPLRASLPIAISKPTYVRCRALLGKKDDKEVNQSTVNNFANFASSSEHAAWYDAFRDAVTFDEIDQFHELMRTGTIDLNASGANNIFVKLFCIVKNDCKKFKTFGHLLINWGANPYTCLYTLKSLNFSRDNSEQLGEWVMELTSFFDKKNRENKFEDDLRDYIRQELAY